MSQTHNRGCSRRYPSVKPVVVPARVPESLARSNPDAQQRTDDFLTAFFSGDPDARRDFASLRLDSMVLGSPQLAELVRARINAKRLEAEAKAIVGISQKLDSPDSLSGRDLAELYRVVKPEKDASGPSFTFVFPTTVTETPNS